MEHSFLIDNCVLVLERKKVKFKKKRKKCLTNPIQIKEKLHLTVQVQKENELITKVCLLWYISDDHCIFFYR